MQSTPFPAFPPWFSKNKNWKMPVSLLADSFFEHESGQLLASKHGATLSLAQQAPVSLHEPPSELAFE